MEAQVIWPWRTCSSQNPSSHSRIPSSAHFTDEKTHLEKQKAPRQSLVDLASCICEAVWEREGRGGERGRERGGRKTGGKGGRGKGQHCTVGNVRLCLVVVCVCVCVCPPPRPHRTPLNSELPGEEPGGPPDVL